MTTTPELIQAYLAQGYTMQQLQAAGLVPAPAAPAFPGNTGISPAFAAMISASLPGAKEGEQAGRKSPEGTHIIELLGMKVDKTFYGETYIVEFIVHSSTNPETEIGGTYSHTTVYDQRYPQYFMDNLKGGVAQVCRARNHQPDNDWQWACGPEQPAKGLWFRVVRTDKDTRNTDPATGEKRVSKKMSDWSPVQPGTTLAPTAPAAPAALPPLPGMPAPAAGLPPLPGAPAFPAPPGAAGLPPLPGMAMAPPPGWPAGVPFPGAGGR